MLITVADPGGFIGFHGNPLSNQPIKSYINQLATVVKSKLCTAIHPLFNQLRVVLLTTKGSLKLTIYAQIRVFIIDGAPIRISWNELQMEAR